MSWSISATGKPAEALASLKDQIEIARCVEPEQSIKAKVGEAIEIALSAYPPGMEVAVSAYGSQWKQVGGPDDGKAQNELHVSITPKR